MSTKPTLRKDWLSAGEIPEVLYHGFYLTDADPDNCPSKVGVFASDQVTTFESVKDASFHELLIAYRHRISRETPQKAPTKRTPIKGKVSGRKFSAEKPLNKRPSSDKFSTRAQTPFISLFTTDVVAKHRAERLKGYTGGDLKLCKISGADLAKAQTHVLKFCDYFPVEDWETLQGELVVWKAIPKEAIVSCESYRVERDDQGEEGALESEGDQEDDDDQEGEDNQDLYV